MKLRRSIEKKKKQKGKIKRSFRENKLNLKKNTLKYHSQKGAAPSAKKKILKNKEKTSKNILAMARYSCNAKKDGTNIIQKILYIQLLILNWRKLYLSGANCYIVPYSRQDNSGYMKLFGQYANQPPLKELTTFSQKAVLNSSFSCPYPSSKKKVFWSPLHNMACQILGYFVIPDWCFAKNVAKNVDNLQRQRQMQRRNFLKLFKSELEKEDIIIFGPNQIVPGKSHLVGANLVGQRKLLE